MLHEVIRVESVVMFYEMGRASFCQRLPLSV